MEDLDQRLQTADRRLQHLVGQQNQLALQIRQDKQALLRECKKVRDARAAAIIIRTAAQATQHELEVRISSLVSLALASIFSRRPYTLTTKFVTKRNRVETNLILVDEEGNECSPLHDVGGGVTDVVALALRITMWSLVRPTPRKVLFLDEPLRFLSVDLQEAAAMLLQEIAKGLGIQIIMITHEERFQQIGFCVKIL
jgi:DNA repair exonuclease SbcCD ATPase subunit